MVIGPYVIYQMNTSITQECSNLISRLFRASAHLIYTIEIMVSLTI